MTAHQHYEIRCDADGCQKTFDAGERQAFRTRELAALVGWVHATVPREKAIGPIKCADFCSVHATLAERKDATT